MPRTCVLAVDQGTTNTKALLMDEAGEVVSRASRRVGVSFPAPGWVEQDPFDLWTSVVEAINTCLADGRDTTIRAIGVTNQRESVVVWDRSTGRPVGPCIVWQCRRTAPFCARLRALGAERLVHEKTGLALDPLFSASKARWLLDQAPDGRARGTDGELCIGTIDSWLLWNLTGGAVHACDVSNASRMQLLNLETLSWDTSLLELFGIPAAALPQVRSSSGVAGVSVRVGALPGGLPIASLVGDSHAALFGHAAFEPGIAKVTYGTGSSLMTPLHTPVLSRAGLSTTVAWGLPDRTAYALEGNITMTGGAVDWLGQLLGLEVPAQAVAGLAASVPDSGGVHVVPAFAGLGAPYWDVDAKGLVCGLTRGTTAAHVARATIESMAFQVRDVFDQMRAEAPAGLVELRADGGGSANEALMQFQADILGYPVVRNRSSDLSAAGAGWLAGLAIGVWSSLAELQALPGSTDRFEPAISDDARARLYEGWQEAVARTRTTGPASREPAPLEA
jgi:glycerol kinase